MGDSQMEIDSQEESQPALEAVEDSLTIPSLPTPFAPLAASYTYHSPTPTTAGPYILGVDEAGRGPALGPMVYGVAYCPASYDEQLNEMGFADSKTLKHDTRSSLLETLSSDPANVGWSVRVLCPQAISSGMLRRPPTNLNRQAEDATILLIREVIDSGIVLSEVYVDALGPTAAWEARLSKLFPGVNFTVTAKADSKFKIVGAASVAAKVTRDAWMTRWKFEEVDRETCADEAAVATLGKWEEVMGSGYPSDPKTQAWLKNSIDPTFGYPSIVRFSWSTIKVALERDGHAVKWIDEGQASLVTAFEGGRGLEKGRCLLARDLGLKSVASL